MFAQRVPVHPRYSGKLWRKQHRTRSYRRLPRGHVALLGFGSLTKMQILVERLLKLLCKR